MLSVTNIQNGLVEMKRYPHVYIQFACSANDTVEDDLFVENLLRNVDRENISISSLFQEIRDDVFRQRAYQKKPFYIDGLLDSDVICLNPKRIEIGKLQPMMLDFRFQKNVINSILKDYLNDVSSST